MGQIIPVGDSLAIFRPEFTLLLAIVGFIAHLLGRTLIPMITGMTVVLSLASLAPFFGNGPKIENPDFILHQHNVLFSNHSLNELIAGVRETDADVLTFQEVGNRNFKQLLSGLEDKYPHYQVCLYTGGGVAVMAKDIGPLLDFGCVKKGKLAWMRIGTDFGDTTFASIHQLWPWPMGQFNQRPILERDLRALKRPIIMAGDFNNVPWSATVKSTANATDGKIAKGLEKSYNFQLPWPWFKIDHVVVPFTARVETSTSSSWGSDHRGITARIRLKN